MAQGISLIVYPVTDLSASKSFYRTLLGVEPYVDGSYYVGFRTGELEVGLDPNARGCGITMPIGYVEVADISEALKSLLDAGAQELRPVTEVGGGLRIATVKDRDGNILGVRQPA